MTFFLNIFVFYYSDKWDPGPAPYYFATSALTSRPYTSDLLSIGFNSEIYSNCKKLIEK
jgi:hypothetical protein